MKHLAHLLTFAEFLQAGNGAVIDRHSRRDTAPGYPYDPNTSAHCTWWFDMDTPTTCDDLLKDNSITIEQFRRWNPSITENCGGLTLAKSYCVEALFETVPEPQPGTPTKSSATKPTQNTPVKPSNSVQTPQPL